MRVAALVLSAASTFACQGSAPEAETRWEIGSPGAEDRGELCSDVGTRRACWAAEFAGRVRQVARTLPNGPAPKGGWRCAGTGRERTCSPRARGAGAFACDATGTCTQRRPRYPDDGEWECTDRSGVVICRGGVSAAGIAPGPPDDGWLCGAGSASLWGDRVCVDLSPDVPDAERDWSCRYEIVGEERRVCTASPTQRVGGPCARASDCPLGSSCVSSVCLPAKPSPGCFVDSDCGSRQCLLGTCAPGKP